VKLSNADAKVAGFQSATGSRALRNVFLGAALTVPFLLNSGMSTVAQTTHAAPATPVQSVPAEPAMPVAEAAGWFSPEQVMRGETLHERRCAHCHSDEKVESFSHWEGTAQELIDMIRSFDMPADRPGGIPAQEYVDIVAYIFNKAGLPEGEEVLAGSDAVKEARLPK